MPDQATLKRAFSLPLLTLYGLGTIMGAGIYVLLGEVVGSAGVHAPLAFLLAAVLAGFSAFSYAELSARFPLSAGEAVYTQRAFGKRWLATLVGLLIVSIGVVSTATLLNGFVGYLQLFWPLPEWVIIVSVLGLLSGVSMWGISQSAWLAAITTLIGIVGLLLIVAVALPSMQAGGLLRQALLPAPELLTLSGILGGAFIAFYAYIGFEDIVNVAEEVREPSRNLPRAVLLALLISTLLYMLVALAALSVLPPGQLARSSAPLALVFQQATGSEPVAISLIGLVAVINGALIQIIMASRVLYGMAAQGWLPAPLAWVNPRTRTPLRSTVLVSGVILLLALWLPLLTLAELTSLITLVVFSLVNLALWRIKVRDPRPVGIAVFPLWLPVAGALFSLAFVLLQLWQRVVA
ncbi:MAG: APC family permease [Gammaproteobacteria bacterium]|nr:APC family permease [Gammaproteobacteria bacterium]MCW8841007.1 APC family permease [Gammaproteobacteria bacterium]MCW8959289.1 APC family permease [Gammaproteobacteria bacterium]MCW8973991.1 APC family permease [Gammaproteobacteria bacterium]MCW8993068.1 APC family permease [Gammaproteobacteria bacterium]